MINNKPVILVTNDDGVSAKGIHSLVEALRGIGKVVVVAPDGARSGQSSAITPNQPLRLYKLKDEEDLLIYKSNGTPVDCVKLACHELFADEKPDIILSGINHGSNAAVSIIYSGTMGAVLEGCVRGIPSVGFSLCSFDSDANFSHASDYIRSIVNDVLQNGLKPGICLNVNFPTDDIRGVKVCRQASGYWVKEYEKRIDPVGRDYYWLTGHFQNMEPEAKDTDEWALSEGFASVVPCSIDMTAHHLIGEMAFLSKNSEGL